MRDLLLRLAGWALLGLFVVFCVVVAVILGTELAITFQGVLRYWGI